MRFHSMFDGDTAHSNQEIGRETEHRAVRDIVAPEVSSELNNPDLSLDDLRADYGETADPRHPLINALPLAPHMNPYHHRLAREVTTLAAHINAAQCEWLTLVAELDRVEAWKIDDGITGTAHWLAWRCGLGIGTAREKVRVARALTELPKTRKSFAAGELSYSVVREVTRIATPQREASILNVCRYGTASHVERLVRHVRRLDLQCDADASFDLLDQRRANWWTRDDGMVEIRVVLAPDQGRVVTAALDAICEQIREESREEEAGTRELVLDSVAQSSFDQQRADAVERLAEMALLAGKAKCNTSDKSAGDATDATANTGARITGGDLTTLMVHVDIDQLPDVPRGTRHSVVGSKKGSKHVVGKPNGISKAGDVPRGTLARLSCDCALVASINDAKGQTISVGRKTRVVSPALRRALERRDLGCTFPGCSNHRHVDAHHLIHWAHGGRTDLDNLTLLCRRHHRLVHEVGFTVQLAENGRPAFFTPKGKRIEPAPVVHVPAGMLTDRDSASELSINHTTTHTLWDGQRPDWGLIVDAVVHPALMFDA